MAGIARVLREELEMQSLVNEGIELVKQSNPYILKHEYNCLTEDGKKRIKKTEKEYKPYLNTVYLAKKIKGKLNKKQKKSNEKFLEYQNSGKINLKIGEEIKKLKDSQNITNQYWKKLLKSYEKPKFNDFNFNAYIGEIEKIGKEKTSAFADYALNAFSENKVKDTLDSMIKDLEDVLLMIPEDINSAYRKYKDVLDENKKKMKGLNKIMSGINNEFKKEERSALNHHKTIKKRSESTLNNFKSARNSKEFKEAREGIQEEAKQYIPVNWIYSKGFDFKQNSYDLGKSKGKKIKEKGMNLKDKILSYFSKNESLNTGTPQKGEKDKKAWVPLKE